MSEIGWLDRLQTRFPEVHWNADDKPILVANGHARSIARLDEIVTTDHAYVVGITDREMPRLARYLRPAAIRFYEMRVADLSPIASLIGLEHLAIEWNTKVTALTPLAGLTRLRTVALVHTPKVRSLVPMESLRELRAFECSGGIWPANDIDSLEPIAGLPLEDVRLTNLRIAAEGIRPLARMKTLRRLQLANQFETADYAYLSVHLPQAACDLFAPFVRLQPSPFADVDVMVVGKRKPFLNSVTDAGRLRRYEEAFRELQRGFAAETIRP